MIGHNHIAIDYNAAFLLQELKAFDDDVFELIFFKQMFPFENCCCEELWMVGVIDCHEVNLQNSGKFIRQYGVCWLVGDNTNKSRDTQEVKTNYLLLSLRFAWIIT